jgi:hypothetical protein
MDTLSCTPAGTPFCPKCGSILQLPDHNPIQCAMCSFSTTYEQVHLPVVTTQSSSRPTPGWAILDVQVGGLCIPSSLSLSLSHTHFYSSSMLVIVFTPPHLYILWGYKLTEGRRREEKWSSKNDNTREVPEM